MKSLKPFPESSEVLRANGECICEACGKTLMEHPKFCYPSGLGEVVLGCDGIYYHL